MEYIDNILCRILLYGTALIIVSALWVLWCQNYWKRKGIYQVKPEFFFGNVKDMFLRKKAFGQAFLDIYNNIKENDGKHGGFYTFFNPMYMPVDPVIIKNIMTKDFEYFMNHGVYYDEDREPLTGHLFNLEGQKWRQLRAKLTPTFTSGKMKNMYKIFLACTETMREVLDEKASRNEIIDIKDISSRYTIDIIGSCAFGIKCNALTEPDSEFRTYGKKIFERDWVTTVSRFATNILPKQVCKFLRVRLIRSDVSSFFINMVKDTVEYRDKNNVVRQDFMQLLLQLKNQDTLLSDETDLPTKPPSETALTLNEIAAQCFIFFLAGYETSATTMTFTLFELAMNPSVQDKLRSEIRTTWELHDKSYDSIMKMTYLEKVIRETLRKYPPIPGTARVCNTTYKIPGSNIVLEKGTRVHIPIIGVHMDPDNYPNPEKFDPERFDELVEASRQGCTWLPFGDGPRTCIGLRFGLLQTKIGIATVINNFRVTLSEKTPLPLEMDPYTFVYSAKGKIWIQMEKI